MSEEHNDRVRRITDVGFHVAVMVMPLLLAVVIYFVKNIFDQIPEIVLSNKIMQTEQSQIAREVGVMAAEQKVLQAQIYGVGTRVEVLSASVQRLERKVDE